MANGLMAGVTGAAIAVGAVLNAGCETRAEAPVASPTRPEQAIFAIVYSAGPKWRPGLPMRDQGLREHFFYMKGLHDSGRIVAAGPLGPTGGLVLLRARDQAEADGVIAADPAVTAGLFVGDARPFVPSFVGAEPLAPALP